jgi:hypothetical protein
MDQIGVTEEAQGNPRHGARGFIRGSSLLLIGD